MSADRAALRRNWCGQCGTEYLDADWQPTRACGPSHAIIAAELSEQIVAALGAAPWQPISTAPKDGTEILLTDPGTYTRTGYFASRRNVVVD